MLSQVCDLALETSWQIQDCYSFPELQTAVRIVDDECDVIVGELCYFFKTDASELKSIDLGRQLVEVHEHCFKEVVFVLKQ
jgi:hypothetical protein